MIFRLAILLAFLGLSVAATAEIVTLVNAIETSTKNMYVPTSMNGTLSFKPCAEDCEEVIRVRVTPETHFVLHGKQMEFSDFRRELSKLRRASSDYVLVSYDTQKSTVTSVRVGE